MRSTKPKAKESATTSTAKSRQCCIKIIELSRKLCIDQTGRFLVTSSKGNKYVIVIYDHDSNVILARAIKTKSALEQLEKIKEIHSYLNQRNIIPKIHIIDNECPEIVNNCITSTKNIELLLVPSYLHHANAAEKRSIFSNRISLQV